MKNTQRGITLIALVVTIVVLLILAGITIAFVLSDGGIFQSAKDAKVAELRAAVSDYADQINPTVTAKYYTNGEKQITLKLDAEVEENETTLDLKKFFPGMTLSAAEEASTIQTGTDSANVTGKFKVTYSGYDFEVSLTNGVVTISKGVKTPAA